MKKEANVHFGTLIIIASHLYSISTRAQNGGLRDHFPMANW